jgi:MoaA/NifB/PqqE/SkfB family radical SAM enzyme
LFGADRVVHERITRIRGSFAKTQAAIAAATECGLEAELHFVPLANNYQELERLVSYARAAGISRISVLRFVPQGRGTLIQNHALNRMQNIELRRSIIRLRSQGNDIRTGSPYNFLMLNDQPKCSSAIDRLIIGPDLRIYPCDAFKQVSAEELVGTLHLSTLRGNSLVDCWENSPFLTG